MTNVTKEEFLLGMAREATRRRALAEKKTDAASSGYDDYAGYCRDMKNRYLKSIVRRGRYVQ